TASWYDASRSIVLAIQRQPGTNTVQVADRVKAAIARLQVEIPPTVRVATLYDRSTTIQASVDDVTFTLELTLALVVMVIILFLFMGGVIGKLFHEFSVTIGVAILVSGFVSYPHADAVEPVSPLPARARARGDLRRHRAILPAAAAPLRADPGLGDGAPAG